MGMDLDLLIILRDALTHNPDEVEVVFVNQWARSAVRSNDKRPGKIEFFVPDNWARNIAGNPKLQDAFICMRVPRFFVDKHIAAQGKVVEQSEENPPASDEHSSEDPFSAE